MTKGQLVDIAANIIFSNEGSYGSVNKDDNGAVSIGKVQWHADRALSLLRTICNANKDQAKLILGNPLYNEILTSNSWATRIVTSAEAKDISALLLTTQGQQAQDSLAKADISTYIDKGCSYGLTDPGALIYFADGVNQYGTNSTLWRDAAKESLQYGIQLLTMHQYIIGKDNRFNNRREKVYKEASQYEAIQGGNNMSYPANPSMPCRDLAQLHPCLKAGAEEFIKRCQAAGLPVLITQTYRTAAYQNQLYAQGRTAPPPPASIVTNLKGGSSPHEFRYAFDICRNVKGQEWDNSDRFYNKCAQIWKEMGGEWGGDWSSFVDMPHFQFTFGITDAQVKTAGGLTSAAKMPWEFSVDQLPVLKRGDGKQFVVSLQAFLVKNGHSITVDGSFGPATETALKAFQQKLSLPVTGVCDKATWELLRNDKTTVLLPQVPQAPQWQLDAFKKLQDVGMINSPEYWATELLRPITVGEVFGLLANLYK